MTLLMSEFQTSAPGTATQAQTSISVYRATFPQISSATLTTSAVFLRWKRDVLNHCRNASEHVPLAHSFLHFISVSTLFPGRSAPTAPPTGETGVLQSVLGIKASH